MMKDLKSFDIVQQGWGVKDLNAGNTHFQTTATLPNCCNSFPSYCFPLHDRNYL